MNHFLISYRHVSGHHVLSQNKYNNVIDFFRNDANTQYLPILYYNSYPILRITRTIHNPNHSYLNIYIIYIGYISYPRTETTHYDKSFDLKRALAPFSDSSSPWHEYVTGLLNKGINVPKTGVDAGDHPPITPTRLAREGELGYDEWKLYDFISSNFIASISYDCKYYKTTAELQHGMLYILV